ncbi:MAG: DUF3987 domain-containing protein, partial [Planctomycetes bacterium]|nr:DUF3987 domain-containing protein [Planctomycetota bacterium]
TFVFGNDYWGGAASFLGQAAQSIPLVDILARNLQSELTIDTSDVVKDKAPLVLDFRAVNHELRFTFSANKTADGKPFGLIVRWDRPSGKKLILPVSRAGSGWAHCGMPAPRPLLCLPELANATRIVIVEGEKVVSATRAIGLDATTSAHGAKSPSKTDWSVCAGKECIILPDNNDAGRKYAADVARLLYELDPRPTIKIVPLPGLEDGDDGDDLIDWLATDGTKEELLELIDWAPKWKPAPAASNDGEPAICTEAESPTDKTPQRKQKRKAPPIPAYKPFPVDVLPEPMRSFINQASTAIGCDLSYTALPLLAGLASAIGNTHRIQIKYGWSEPSVLWCVIVGESGSLKSPAIDAALGRIRQRQAKALAEFKKELEEYDREAEVHKVNMSEWRKSGHKNGEPMPLPPEKPTSGRSWCSDTTVEALAALLDDAPRGILVIRDELSGWLRSFDAYKSGKGADVAHYLEMHRAGHLLVDRKTGDRTTISVPRAAVSIVGGIQPETLRRALGEENFENGLAARFLMTMPPRRCKRWRDAMQSRVLEGRLNDVFDWLFALEAGMDENGEPRPILIPLSPEGRSAWISFYNEFAIEQASLTGALAAAMSKLEGCAARLALIVHLVRCATEEVTLGNPIDAESIRIGVRLVHWFVYETKRVYAILGEADGDRENRQLVELIERKGGNITVREIMRSSRMFGEYADAESALQGLVDSGEGTWITPKPGPKGGPPSKRFELLTSTTEGVAVVTTIGHDHASGGCDNGNGVSAAADEDWGVV